MTVPSTTIRVTLTQRDRLRYLAEARASTMADTLDAALEALRRDQFFRSMAEAEAALRLDQAGWADYIAERDAWLDADLVDK